MKTKTIYAISSASGSPKLVSEEAQETPSTHKAIAENFGRRCFGPAFGRLSHINKEKVSTTPEDAWMKFIEREKDSRDTIKLALENTECRLRIAEEELRKERIKNAE